MGMATTHVLLQLSSVVSVMILSIFNVGSGSAIDIILQHSQTSITNGSRNYIIPPLKELAYVIGCIRIDVYTTVDDFDLEFISYTTDGKPIGGSKWYSSFRVASRYLWKSAPKQGAMKTWCLSPFEKISFHVEPSFRSQKYTIKTSLRLLEPTCLLCLVSGLLFFFYAPSLSRSAAFYYSSSVGVGMLASALILVLVVSRLLPKKQAGYTVLLGGWTVCVWAFTQLWNNIYDILSHHYYVVLGYAFVAGFIGFAACYRYGPPENPRSHHIIQWTLQLLSLLLVYNGTQLRKVSMAIICSLLTYSGVKHLTLSFRPRDFAVFLARFRIFKWLLGSYGKPKPRKLLTDDEYRRQGEIETQKALEELREFCQSPKCSPWKTLSRLETPKRFACFIEGENHINEDESILYDTDMPELAELEEEHVSERKYVNEDEYVSEDEDNLISEDDELELDGFIIGNGDAGLQLQENVKS